MSNNKLGSMINKHDANIFGFVNILFSMVALFTLSVSIFKQKDDLKMAKIKRCHIAETSQHFFTNMCIMFIVFVYNISIFITMFFSADPNLVSHSVESKINVAIAPIMTLFVGVHILGTIKWDFFGWPTRLFVLMPSFIVSLIYQVTFVIFNYQLLVDLNNALKIHGGAMVRAFIIDGFAVFLTIMYFRALEQVLHFHKYNAPSRAMCEMDGPDTPRELMHRTSRTSTTSVTQFPMILPHEANNNNSVRYNYISTTNLLKLMCMVTLFVVIDFFTIDDQKNECTIPVFSAVIFSCLYYTFTYLLLFYAFNIYGIIYHLIKIKQILIQSSYAFNRSFLWWHHIAFIFALIGCLMDDICTVIQRILYPSENEAHLNNIYVIFVIVIQIAFRALQFHFILLINKYSINYSHSNMKNIKFYAKFLVLTNCCLIGHYFLYEMRHKQHITAQGHEPQDDTITVIQIIVAFLNIEFYLAAVEKIDLYKHLLIAENETNPKQSNLLAGHEPNMPVIIGMQSSSSQSSEHEFGFMHHPVKKISEHAHNEKIEVLNERISVLENEKQEQYQRFEAENEKWQMIAAENTEMKQVVIEKQDTIDTLQNTLDEKVNANKNLRQKMQNKVNELNDTIKKLVIEKNNLNKQCDKMSKDFEDSKLKIEKLVLKIKVLQEEIVSNENQSDSQSESEIK